MQRLAQFPFRRSLEDPGDFGEQVTAPAREFAQLGHRRGMPGIGQLVPRCAPLRHARQPGDENTISFRPVIEHGF
jgi:hypothetical protein